MSSESNWFWGMAGQERGGPRPRAMRNIAAASALLVTLAVVAALTYVFLWQPEAVVVNNIQYEDMLKEVSYPSLIIMKFMLLL